MGLMRFCSADFAGFCFGFGDGVAVAAAAAAAATGFLSGRGFFAFCFCFFFGGGDVSDCSESEPLDDDVDAMLSLPSML